jgi:hypothetical protein
MSLNFLQTVVCYEISCSTEMKLSFFAKHNECQVYFYHHTSHEHTGWQNSVLLLCLDYRGCDPQLVYLAFRTDTADMSTCCASWDINFLGDVSSLAPMVYAQSAFIPCISRCAQSGRRTFGRRVWFIESHIVFAIVFLLVVYLFIYSWDKGSAVVQLNN